jgi:hypothetical protein
MLHALHCRTEAALSQLQHYAALSAAEQLDIATLQGSTAAELACFAGIDESEYGSMEALDKQVRVHALCWYLGCDMGHMYA